MTKFLLWFYSKISPLCRSQLDIFSFSLLVLPSKRNEIVNIHLMCRCLYSRCFFALVVDVDAPPAKLFPENPAHFSLTLEFSELKRYAEIEFSSQMWVGMMRMSKNMEFKDLILLNLLSDVSDDGE